MVTAIAKTVATGVVHELPQDLRDALVADPTAHECWESLTPLGRNEFICWVEDAKQAETRARRIERTLEELHEGKRRPCCWAGCIHRTDKAPSASQRFVFERAGKLQPSTTSKPRTKTRTATKRAKTTKTTKTTKAKPREKAR